MFYFLILTGFLLILLGVHLTREEGEASSLDIDQSGELEERLSNIEELIFDDLLERHKNTQVNRDDEGDKDEEDEGFADKMELLNKYEGENRSLDEICQLLEMTKGEVLLLKNLYKDR